MNTLAYFVYHSSSAAGPVLWLINIIIYLIIAVILWMIIKWVAAEFEVPPKIVKMIGLLLFLVLILFLFVGCATTTPAQRSAAAKQVLRDSASILGSAVVRGITSAVTQEVSSGNVNWQQAAAGAMQIAVSDTDITNEIARVKSAMAGATQGNAPVTTAAAVSAFRTATSAGTNPETAAQAIANVIFTATGVPPAP